MKKLTLMVLIAICTLTSNAQNAKLDATGNYVAVVKEKETVEATPMGKTFTDAKGVVYPIFLSKAKKLFIKRISKAGKEYNQYLKL
jgi:hypothetical protein